MQTIDWVKVWRVLVLGQAAHIFCTAVYIIFFYGRSLKHARSRALVWHVLMITLSYLMLATRICLDMYVNWGKSMTWRLQIAFVAFTLGNVGLSFLLIHLRDARTRPDRIT